MHTQLFDLKDDYNRALRARRIKRALAWIGVITAGSLLVFCAGIYVLTAGFSAALADLFFTVLFAWGLWGFIFLKNRH